MIERARAMGYTADFDKLNDHELFRLILEPGFSTASEVTEFSGRGVGMDVVRRNVEALRGVISIESRAGVGTTITIRLPLTLAIIRGFAVGVNEETYIMPLDAVIECIELPRDGQRSVRRSRRDQPAWSGAAVPCGCATASGLADSQPSARTCWCCAITISTSAWSWTGCSVRTRR